MVILTVMFLFISGRFAPSESFRFPSVLELGVEDGILEMVSQLPRRAQPRRRMLKCSMRVCLVASGELRVI